MKICTQTTCYVCSVIIFRVVVFAEQLNVKVEEKVKNLQNKEDEMRKMIESDFVRQTSFYFFDINEFFLLALQSLMGSELRLTCI